MELYILSKQDLKILSICKVANYEINLDEETNAKSTFTLIKTNGLVKDNFMVLNGLYRQFLFVISEVQTEKGSDEVTVTALDISNIFDRKVIEKNTDTMQTASIEEFIANTMYENFVNSSDTVLNVGYIDIAWNTNTQAVVDTNAENGLYNFHTFLINCRQYKNIYTEFKFEDNRLKIDISYKEETIKLIDTTLPEVTDYNKVYEDDVTAKVTVLIREDGSEYNLYLRTDRTTTTDKNDTNRAKGKIEVISVDTADKASEEALNVIKGNSYNHLVEFKIAKTSKVMDITELHIGRTIRIKTDDDIYDSYISAITLTDENFVYFKSGNIRTTLLDKLKKNASSIGNKLDKTGGTIVGNLNITGNVTQNGQPISAGVSLLDVYPIGSVYMSLSDTNPTSLFGGTWEQIKGRFLVGCGSNGVDLSTEAGDVGGEANHTLTINEMPSHEHDIIYGANNKYVQLNTGSDQYKLTWTTDGEARYGAELKAKAVGGNQPHNNLPPYLSVYMWKRTA